MDPLEILKPTRRNCRRMLASIKRGRMDRVDSLLAQNKARRRRLSGWVMRLMLKAQMPYSEV